MLVTVTGSPHQVANVEDITITEPPPDILDHVGVLVTVTGSLHQVANVADIIITEPPPVILDQVGWLVTVTGCPHQVANVADITITVTSSHTRSDRLGFIETSQPALGFGHH